MIKRHILALIRQSISYFPAILLNGARQVGKSTIAKQIVDEGVLDDYLTLDDLFTFESAQTDPDGFLQEFPGKIVIDEIQRAPKLLLGIKKRIDLTGEPSQFLLTGSANLLSHPQVAESLAGRTDIISLEGLSLGELYKSETPSPILEDLFSDLTTPDLIRKWTQRLKNFPKLTKNDLCKAIYYGGYPRLALEQSSTFTKRWFSSYLKSYVEKDVRDLSQFLDIVSFSKLLRLVGFITGNLLNIKNLSADIGIDQRTTARYLEILSITFQINLLNPWHSNIRKRLIKTPKVYLNDSGFACYLHGINGPDELLHHRHIGALAETWIWSELRKLLVYQPSIEAHFYRTHQGKEVDFLFSQGERHLGIEFKWSNTLSAKDFAGLKDLQSQLGEQLRGVVLYPGDEIVPFGHNLLAFPIPALL